MSETDIESRGLACTNCRRRKVRCNHARPSCDRCVSLHISCNYPARQPRAPNRKKARRDDRSVDAISAILERLRRFEEHTSRALRVPTPPSIIPPAVQRLGDTASPNPAPDRCNSCGKSTSNTPSAAVNSLLTPDPLAVGAPLDAASTLSDAVDSVRQLRSRHNTSVADFVTQQISIPTDAARRWIETAFSLVHWNLFPAFLDQKLIRMMPDLVDMPNVHIDASIILIYYCILWQGCFFGRAQVFGNEHNGYARQLYVCCLRSIAVWQSSATGTPADFVAAMYMAQTASENLELDLAWDMHRRACEYAHKLELHNLDASAAATETGLTLTDSDRVAMWNLIQLDLFHRLVNNKTAAFPADLAEWRVNMPWMTVDKPPGRDEAAKTMAFLAGSRLTFILMGFFQSLESMNETTTDANVLATIEPFCQQVAAVFDEWKVDEWLRGHTCNDESAWILGDLAMAGWTSVLFMLRRACLVSPHANEDITLLPAMVSDGGAIPMCALSLRASRHVLEALCHLIEMGVPGPEILCFSLGTYRVHIAYGHLASGVIEKYHLESAPEDCLLLARTAQCVEGVVVEQSDFAPLLRAMNMILDTAETQVKTSSAVSSAATTPGQRRGT